MTTIRGTLELSESEREIRERSLEYLESMGSQIASERNAALKLGERAPIGFVISAGVEQFPASNEEESSGVMVMATAFISHSNTEEQLQQLFGMIRQQVENG
ncbi:MAG: hypothetical protein F4Z38_08275 [Chloroflexi bacterium]|nr:hypothetical protein [Chloroflexota bacterium]